MYNGYLFSLIELIILYCVLPYRMMFDSGLDPTHFYNKQWLATEVIEIAGMMTLCLSYIDANRFVILFIELVGFSLLACAAMLTVNLYPDRILPEIIIRNDYIHVLDSFGLFLLGVVSCGQCRIKGLQQNYSKLMHHGSRDQVQHGNNSNLSLHSNNNNSNNNSGSNNSGSNNSNNNSSSNNNNNHFAGREEEDDDE